MKTRPHLLLFGAFICLTACMSGRSTDGAPPQPPETIIIEEHIDSQEESSYEHDWKIIQKALLEKNKVLLKAYASAEVDLNELTQIIHQESDFLEQLEQTEFDGLKSTQGVNDEPHLRLALTTSGVVDGYEYESGLYLYFKETEDHLILNYYYIAG